MPGNCPALGEDLFCCRPNLLDYSKVLTAAHSLRFIILGPVAVCAVHDYKFPGGWHAQDFLL